MGGLQGLLHDIGQIVPDRVQVYGVGEACREGGHRAVSVVASPVEPAVHYPLHPPSQWVNNAAAVSVEAIGGLQAEPDAEEAVGDLAEQLPGLCSCSASAAAQVMSARSWSSRASVVSLARRCRQKAARATGASVDVQRNACVTRLD